MTTRTPTEPEDGYEAFFGLTEAPFSLSPNPRFLFASASHSAALAQVAYALQRREPLIVVTGEIGTGKTLLCRTVLQRLRRKTFLSVINDPLLERDDLLKQMLQDFGVISQDRTKLTATSRHQLVEALHAFLKSLTPLQAHAVVIVDDAQHLHPEVLEQIRLLSNIDDEEGTLLQIILVGQRDLDPLLARPELRQLQQRVSRRIPLEPLSSDEVAKYVEHRLALARVGRPPSQSPGATALAQELAAWDGIKPSVEFTTNAIQAVSELSGGVPRVINLLCDRSLEEAYGSRLRIIDGPLVQAAARELAVGAPDPPAPRPDLVAPGTEAEPDETSGTARLGLFEGMDQIVQPTDRDAVGLSDHPVPATPLRLVRYLPLAALAVAAVAIFFVVRPSQSPAGGTPAAGATAAGPTTAGPTTAGATAAESSASGASSSAPPADTQPAAAPAAANPPTLAAPVTGGGQTLPSNTPSTIDAPAADPRFDIVVASFRTDARATSVAAEVASLGLPIRRRVADGWQQVLSGPFASRPAAEEAQQLLNRAGISGTQIVPARDN
ncbi:MAG: AAA family ATPase [Acidobacteriota bacterium]